MEYWPNELVLLESGEKVMLDRRVPGDATKWYVGTWDQRHHDWFYVDDTIEEAEIIKRLDNPDEM